MMSQVVLSKQLHVLRSQKIANIDFNLNTTTNASTLQFAAEFDKPKGRQSNRVIENCPIPSIPMFRTFNMLAFYYLGGTFAFRTSQLQLAANCAKALHPMRCPCRISWPVRQLAVAAHAKHLTLFSHALI